MSKIEPISRITPSKNNTRENFRKSLKQENNQNKKNDECFIDVLRKKIDEKTRD